MQAVAGGDGDQVFAEPTGADGLGRPRTDITARVTGPSHAGRQPRRFFAIRQPCDLPRYRVEVYGLAVSR